MGDNELEQLPPHFIAEARGYWRERQRWMDELLRRDWLFHDRGQLIREPEDRAPESTVSFLKLVNKRAER